MSKLFANYKCSTLHLKEEDNKVKLNLFIFPLDQTWAHKRDI